MSRDTAPRHGLNLERSVQFGMLAAVQVTLILAITVIAIGLPAVAAEMRLRPGQLALVSAGYGLAFSGLLLFGGRVADRWGPRGTLVAGLVGFGLASAAAGLSADFWGLLLARLAQGAGAALAAPAAMALLGSVFPDRAEHARAVAWWGGLAPLGATGGIVLSGAAAGWASWRWGFAVPIVVAAVVVALARRLPAGRPPVVTRLDLPGALLVTAGVAAVSYALVTAGDRGWAAPEVVAGLLVGALALAAFVAVEVKSSSPLLPLRLLRSRRRLTGLGVVMVVAAGHSSIGFFLVLYLQQIRELPPIATTAAFLPFLLPLPLAGLLATRLLGRFRAPAVAAAGLALAATGLLLIGQLTVATPYAGTLLAGLLVFPIGAGMTFAAATVVAVDGTPESEAGLAGGLLNTAVELGPTLGLAVLVGLAGTRTTQLLQDGQTAAAATTGGYAFALAAAAAVFAVVAAAMFLQIRPLDRGLRSAAPAGGRWQA